MQENELKRYEDIGNWDFSDIKYTTYQESNWNFYDEIKNHSTSSSLLLDLGTGGGEKALSFLPNVGMIIATDFSKEMIKTANENKKQFPDKNIKFVCMDNLNITFPKNLFDIVSARHTMIDAKRIYDVLKNDGYLIIEGVDKQDCWELKTLFQRGQAFHDEIAISQIDYENIKKAGFREIQVQKIIQYEYYETEEDLLALLFKTPIINDFSGIEDSSNTHSLSLEKNLFDKYVSTHTTPKGIELERVLYGIIAKK